MSANPVRDVSVRQVRGDPVAGLRVEQIGDGRERGDQIGVGELDAFGRPGGSRGVDQRADIVWPYRSPRRIEIEICFRA
jgi:hypothetical protein